MAGQETRFPATNSPSLISFWNGCRYIPAGDLGGVLSKPTLIHGIQALGNMLYSFIFRGNRAEKRGIRIRKISCNKLFNMGIILY
jgi:hypothetical protein